MIFRALWECHDLWNSQIPASNVVAAVAFPAVDIMKIMEIIWNKSGFCVHFRDSSIIKFELIWGIHHHPPVNHHHHHHVPVYQLIIFGGHAGPWPRDDLSSSGLISPIPWLNQLSFFHDGHHVYADENGKSNNINILNHIRPPNCRVWQYKGICESIKWIVGSFNQISP